MLGRTITSSLPKVATQFRCYSASIATITRIRRPIYCRTYPTIFVLPDGSSVTVRYHEPRQIVKLPLDLSTLTEAERKARIEARKPKTKITIEEDVDDSFDSKKYLKYLKKK